MAVAEFTRALQDTEEIELTVTGRTTGRKTSRPVWFVQEGDALYLLPVKGSDSAWFRNVLENPTVTLSADKRTSRSGNSAIPTRWSGRTILAALRGMSG